MLPCLDALPLAKGFVKERSRLNTNRGWACVSCSWCSCRLPCTRRLLDSVGDR